MASSVCTGGDDKADVMEGEDKYVAPSQSETEAGDQCLECSTASPDLKRCAQCKEARYCSRDCQVKHWPTHKPICKSLREKYSIVLDMERDLEVLPFSSTIGLSPGSRRGKKPDRQNTTPFIVKIQSPAISDDGAQCLLYLYDKTRDVNIHFRNARMYHILFQRGIGGHMSTDARKVYCWANFEQKGKKFCINVDKFAPIQPW